MQIPLRPEHLPLRAAKVDDTRANITIAAGDVHTYTFQGGKIEVSNEKLSGSFESLSNLERT